jgi:hypothetical protein
MCSSSKESNLAFDVHHSSNNMIFQKSKKNWEGVISNRRVRLLEILNGS